MIAAVLLAVQVPLALSLPFREDRWLGWAPFHETATYTIEAGGLDADGIRDRYGLYRRLGPDGRDWQTNRMAHVLQLVALVESRSPDPLPVRVRFRVNGGPEQIWDLP